MDIEKADVVESLAGRDKGKLFFVVGADETYVLLADGKGRKLEHPKRKKRKHVRKVPWGESRVRFKLASGDVVRNSELRRELAIGSQVPADQEGETNWQKTM